MRVLLLPTIVLLLLCQSTPSAQQQLIRVCESDLDYPPFSYVKISDDGHRYLDGFSIKLLHRVIDPSVWQVELVILPFNRCIRDSADLSVADMVLTASLNAEREKVFLPSEPFWFAHFHAFYRRAQFPSGLPVEHKQDLRRFHLCGIKGHNVSMFDIPEAEMDLGSEDYDAVFRKLSLGRCEVFPYNLEVIEGHQLLGKTWLLGDEFAHQAIRDVKPWPFQMLIARRYPFALLLQADINEALQEMQRSGELQTLYQQSLHSK